MCEPDISFETAYYYIATIARATFAIASITIAITITATMLHTKASLIFSRNSLLLHCHYSYNRLLLLLS